MIVQIILILNESTLQNSNFPSINISLISQKHYKLYTIIVIIVYNIKKLVKNEVNYAKSLF